MHHPTKSFRLSFALAACALGGACWLTSVVPAHAQRLLAQVGVPNAPNPVVAQQRQLAVQGNARAQGYLGHLYWTGEEGVARDYRLAFEWLSKAAAQGDAYGQTDLGCLYDAGNGVPQDFRLAVEWFRKAAAQNVPAAQSNLGYMYENARGVARDLPQALYWYRLAAAGGHAPARQLADRLINAGVVAASNSTGAAGTPAAVSPSTNHFVSDRSKLDANRAAKFVEFSYNYPTTWTLREGTQTKFASNFVETNHLANAANIASFNVGSFRSNDGTSAAAALPSVGSSLVAQLEPSLRQGFPGYRKLSENSLRFNGYTAYELRATAFTSDGPGGVALWMRWILVAPPDNGPAGVIVVLIGTAQEPGIRGIGDVGTTGDLAVMANSFRFGR